MLLVQVSSTLTIWFTPTLSGPSKFISIDFITDIPSSKGFDSILTIVDRFTKMSHFLPCTKTINSQETTDLVMREVFRHHDIRHLGNTCLGSSKLIVKSLQAIVQSLAVKLNVPIKPCNDTFLASSIINRMIG